jgi:hypothetical protein
MPLRPVTDPALLSELEAAPASAPGAAPVPSGLRPVTDRSLLAALESDTAEPQPRSALAEFTRVAQPSAMERMGKEGFVPSIARPDPEVAKRLPGELASAARIGFQSGLSSIRKVIADERAWLARKAAESHAAGGYGLSPEETERAIQQDMARAGIAEMESARETRQFRRLGEQAEAITPEDAGFVERSAIGAFRSLGATALPVAAGALVPGAQVPALIALSGQAAAQRYTELTAQGIDPEEAAKSALMLGPLEGLLERAPMGTLAKKSPVVRQFFEFLVRDLAGEEVATLAELADDYRLGLADEVTVADVRQAMLDTAAQTTIAAGVQVGAVQALQSIVDRANELAQRRRPKIEEPTEEQIAAGITPPTIEIDDEALTDEQLDAEIERLERELGSNTEVADAPRETTKVVEQPDVEATFETEELERMAGPPPAEDRVEILPSTKREGWFVVQVNGEPQAEVESREKAEELAEGLKVEVRAHEAATSPKNDLPEPTAAQIEAGNYKKGHIKVHGLDISIENPIGSIRRSKPDAPVQWERKMRDHYGYIRGTEDNTGEHVDVFVAAEPKGDKVFVIDQVIDGKFDEPKVLVGYESEKEARRAYLRNYQRGWKGLGAITALSVPEFKRWLNSGGPTRPLSWKPPEERRSTRRPDPRNDSLLEYISKVRLGETSGLNFDDLVAEGLDPAELRAARGHGINRPFTKRGASLDEMAEHLAEVGFPVLDENGNYDKNILLDLITKDLRQGTRTMSAWAQNYDEELERLAQKYDFDRDEAEELVDTAIRFDEHADLTDEELNRLEAQLERIAKIEADRQPAEETEPDIPFSVRDRRTADMFGAKPTEPRKSEAPARQRAVQGDLFGGASEIQQMLERVRAEKDRRRNTGQESLETGDPTDLFSQARKQTDIEDKAKPPVAKAGEIREDLVTYEGPAARDDRVQADTRTDVDAKHGASAVPVDVHASGPVQLDIFANAAQPEPAARAARLLARTRHVETGSFKTSLERIRHWEDAAHLIAPLRKSPQEQFLAIVLDEKSQPIAVLRHTVGLVGLSPVDPGIVAGSIVRIPGARRVYFAHNHPSGEIAPSKADFEVTQLLVDALEGTQVEPLGMIIVGPGRKDATFFRPRGYPETSPITRASRRGRSVPQIERRFRKVFDRQSPIIDNPAKAIDAIRKVDEQSGVLLLDFKGRLIGVVPMDEAEMQRLRTGDPSRGAARLLAALEEANASIVIPFGSTASARNVAAFFRHADVNVAYVAHRQADQWVIDQSGRIGGRFFFSEKKTPRSAALEAHREKIEAAVQKALKGVDGAPKVFVLRRITDVPKHVKDRYPLDSISPARARGIEGMYDWQRGEIYLFSDALTSPARAAWVLFHELAGHHGVRRAAEMLGIDVNEVHQRVLNNRFVRQLAEEIAAQRGITDPLRAADEALAELAAAVRTGNYDHIQDRYGLKVPPAQRNTIRGLITRLIQAIRRALARRFGVRTQDFSDADVYALLQRAWRSATAQTDTIVQDAPAFSRSEAEGRDLIITHKTTAEKLLHAVRMGGFAVPSLAVTRIDGPLKGFGDIFLVGDERMATPSRQTKVFGADIYSPRYPRVEFKLNNQAVKKIADTLKPYMVKGERFYIGTTTTIDDLTAVDAFKRYVEAKHNLKNGEASYSLIKEEAENLFRESGASEILFKGFTNAGNRRYVPHTLENVVKTLKKELRGGEAFNYGVGSLRAHFAPQFKTLAQIRKAKGRLVSEEDFKKVKDEVDNEFFELVDALRPYYTYDANRFGFSDTVMAVMADAARMGLPRALAEYGFRDVPQEIQRNISAYLNKLRTLPTEYFEAKILRGVGLNEFRGALVPEGTDQKVLDALDRAGVRWKFYRNGEAPAALRQLADEIEAEYGARVLFSEGEAPAPVFYSAVLRAARTPPLRQAQTQRASAFSIAPPAESEAFKRWFGDSKVVDKHGKPLVVYHGTRSAWSAADGPVWLTEDPDIAAKYAESKGGEEVMELYAKAENPLIVSSNDDVRAFLEESGWSDEDISRVAPEDDRFTFEWFSSRKVLAAVQSAGHDSVYLENDTTDDGRTEHSSWLVLRPQQIKSAIGNRGTFDPNEPSIVLSESPAPPFYSAVLRAAESSKLTKGNAQQWLGTLRNQPGVKQEELDWIGLEDWLNSLGRAATKQEVADFIRANQITVSDVLRGTPADAKAISERERLQQKRDDLVVRLTALGYQPLLDFGGTEMWGVQGRDGDDWTYLNEKWLPDNEEAEAKGELPEDVAAIAVELGELYEALDNEVFEDDVPNQATRYGRYTIPGGRNYRELLLTIPGESRPAMSFEEWADARGIDLSNADDVEALRDSYRRDARHFESGNVFHSSHWNEPNILAHVRFDERVDQEGKRVLFIEEIQSDWHQEGRRKGYRPTDTSGWTARPGTVRPDLYEVFDAEGRSVALSTVAVNQSPYGPTPEQAQRKAIAEVANRGVPNAPFKTTWPELAFKRMLRWAAENGFDRIAWTTGEQQAERYDLSKQVDTIGWLAHDDGTFTIDIEKDGRTLATERSLSPERLEEMVGKDVAEKIVEGAKSADTGELKGLDLKVGGEGMRGFYDQILPKVAAKLTKKWGGKVGETYLLATGDAKLLSNDNAQNAAAIGAAPVHSLDITPAMREAALAGLPLFSEAQDPRLARLERLKQIRAMRKAARAGEAYVPMYQGGQVLPLTATAVQIGTGPTARTVPVPKEPIRREHIIKELERQFGVHIYQGRPFKGRMLGFFRPSNFEVRIKHKNDLEVTAHEIFHWLEATYPELGQLYRQKQFGQELRSISYDAKKLDEGFAEFGRLFLTQDSQAQAKAPNFYIAFTAKAQQLGIYEKLAKVQDRMHQWYMQGALGRAMSKQGVKAEPLAQRMSALADVWADRATAETVDYLHAAKVIERTLTGTIANDAMQSPYKSLRLLAGARNTIESFLNFGTLNWTPKGLEFTGKGLKQVFEPVANHMEETLLYFVGRRAEELAKYGKERLFTPDEIGAMLDAGRLSPKAKEIEQAFNEYQAYVDRLMDFAEASGIVSADTRALWKAMYQNYVPFYRVSETLGTTRLSGPTISNPFKRLFGGTANLNDIWDNMVMNTAIVVHASLRNVAKRQLFNTIEKSPLGQRFAVRIPTEAHSVKVAMQQVEQVLRGLVDEAERRALDPSASAAEKAHYAQVHYALDVLTSAQSASGGSSLEAMQEQATFYVGGQPPSIPDKDSVLVDGKRVWYQIADPLLWDMLTDINYHKPIGLLEVVFSGFKRTLTRGVTLTPEFQIANLIRDTLNAFTMSRGGQVPFVHVLGAMVDALRRSEDYKLFLANGGGFGNATPVNEGRRVRMKMRRLYQGGRVNIRAILDTPAKVLDFWDRFGQAYELGTRLAEFKLIKKQGLSLREAAFQGREISSDFAMQGRARTVKAAITSLPFFNARLQGLYRLERELFERNGRQSWRGERQLQYAMRGLIGITIPSLILYWWNKDDEDYQELSDEIKQLYYPVKIPNTHDFVLIPKPFETGAIFSTVPEQVWQYLETKNDRRLVEAAKFTITQTFAFDPVPQAVRPMWEWYANKDWRGLPIVPKNLENVEPREQYKWNTSPTLVEIGKRFDVSPIALDHFLRGYLGGTAAYLTMASDSLVTSKRWGEEPASRLSEYPVARRFLREAPYGNTRYQREFWDLYREVDRVANTARKIREEFRQDDLDAYLGDAEKAVLFGLGGAFGAKGFVDQAAQKAREISAAQIRVRRDPQMSGEQKRQELDKLQHELNELFKSVIKQLNTEQLERYRDALEGKRPQANARQVYDMLAPMIEGKPRRQAVAALREAGYADLASLIASLPPTPDKDAIAFFQRILEEP